MSTEILIKGAFSAAFSLVFACGAFFRYDDEIGSELSETDYERYLPYLPAMLLPVCVIVVAAMALPAYGLKATLQMTLSMCFGIFLHISCYYLVLMLFMPVLRKRISSRACALLWIVPNYLYYTQAEFMEVPKPLLVLRAPGNWIWIVVGIWVAGFIAVLVWKIIEHLIFRHHILKDSRPVTDSEILALWQTELEDAAVKRPKFKLVISPAVSAPLSIGFFKRGIRVVLPDQIYSHSELKLIFRHEIIHVCREDSSNKFFLLFCAAMCWFNPLMWIAMRKSANDLELSCDETALLGADEETRWKYANLLLRTAGDEKGFTTCLSASASALRYRLHNVIKPRKTASGAIIVGLICFVLYMSCGYIALSYGGSTGAEVLYQSRDTSLYTLDHITTVDDPYNTPYECVDDEAFHAYMAGLTMENLTGNYSFSEYEQQYTFIYMTPEGALGVTLSDNAIELLPLYGGNRNSTCYYLPDGVDWEYLNTLIRAQPSLSAI